MALASQVPRPDLLRRPMSRHSRRRNRRIRLALAVVVIAVVAGLGWLGYTYFAGGPTGEPVDLAMAENTDSSRETSETERAVMNPVRSSPTRSPSSDSPGPISNEAAGGGDTPAVFPHIAGDDRPGDLTDRPATDAVDASEPDIGRQSPRAIRSFIQQAVERQNQGHLLEARVMYNEALHSPETAEQDRAYLRAKLTLISDDLIFGPTLLPDDPYIRKYVVKSGDYLSTIVSREQVAVHHKFIQRINRMSNANTLRVGQTLKLPNGVFHAVVNKSDYRLDLYIGEPDSTGNRMYVRSFDVGLGEYDSTPEGGWVIKPRSKTVNPSWRNPRTGEFFDRDDPDNPIGEFWLGLAGTDPNTEVLASYGIHGTNEPDSIGRSMSMGCIRMRSSDIELVWEILAEGRSTLQIVP
jgi:LysM repeat protein